MHCHPKNMFADHLRGNLDICSIFLYLLIPPPHLNLAYFAEGIQHLPLALVLVVVVYKVIPLRKATETEQHFLVALFIMLYRVVLTFDSWFEISMCDHSNESYSAVLSCGSVYYAIQGGSNF